MMNAFYAPLKELRSFEQMEEHIAHRTGIFSAGGCIDAQKSQLIGAAGRGTHPRLVAAGDEQRARQLLSECRFYDPDACYFPARDILFYQSDVRGNALTRERMTAYRALREQEAPLIVTTIDALMEKLLMPEILAGAGFAVRTGEELDLEQMKRKLVCMGYEAQVQAEQPGQFAVRGGIIDVFCLTEEMPYRIELWGDEVDSVRRFDAGSQRSVENLEEVFIDPASELVLDQERISRGAAAIRKDSERLYEKYRSEQKTQEAFRLKENSSYVTEQLLELAGVKEAETYMSYFYEETAGLLDYLEFYAAQRGKKPVVFLDEPRRCMARARALEEEYSQSMQHRLETGYALPGQMDVLLGKEQTAAKLSRMCTVSLGVLDAKEPLLPAVQSAGFTVQPVSSYGGSFELLVKDLKKYHRQGYRLLLTSGSHTRARRLSQDLQNEDVMAFYSEDTDRILQKGETMVTYGKMSRGFSYPELKFAVLTEDDIFGRKKAGRKPRKKYEGEQISRFSDLAVGDYVVHEKHGLGIYRGIEKVEINHVVRDYIKIEYAKGGNLYVLPTQMDMIQKYAGSDAARPKLNRLGGQEWNRTKSRVKGAVQEIAEELVELYAVRQSRDGYACGPDTVWQQEFEELFPYEETADQLAAIAAVKHDMESRKIMDRLICGDVGFGKTEIAIRAAFKAVQEGRQVAYLVPTTILAQQHYNTFSQRMKDFPVQVDLLCRFRTAKEQRVTIDDLKRGMCDVVIGTHRLLSKDVSFKNLGLLIIDEEQRFGVSDKEKIKQLRKDVDVLTLTATPIPRTLHMSLIGIRDMSVLEEPPQDRMPVQTYVMEYDDEMVREAVSRELSRGGQVYYVFNRVNQIADITARISKLLPDAVVEYAHGQMPERDLEDVMYRFISGEIDVLVSTTIIETGLDISNVNTMIIHDADNMGLSQLYQLRGRIGRSNRTSYAFLMYRRGKLLREVAEKRLAAIRDFSELGSGFRIAMKDLEIRGAGNILGAQQHGHMEAVGYDLYCKMLSQAVKKQKGEAPAESFETSVDLDVDAYIPADYIPNENQKLAVYKRIACVETKEDAQEVLDELLDRFGEPPKQAQTLLSIAELKGRAHRAYLTEISEKGQEIMFVLYEQAKIDVARIPEIVKVLKPYLTFRMDSKNPSFCYRKQKNSPDSLTAAEKFIVLLEGILITDPDGM